MMVMMMMKMEYARTSFVLYGRLYISINMSVDTNSNRYLFDLG